MSAKTKTRRSGKYDRAKVEKELLALERQLRADMRRKLGNVHNTSLSDPTELLDMASDGELDYMAALSAEAGSVTISEIQMAIQKLRGGTYGVCEGCGREIAPRRLKARPFACLCIACKEAQERFGYVEAPSEVSVRGDYGVVDLTDRDTEGLEESYDDVFRNVEDAGVY